MSLIKAIKAQLGLSNTATQNFTLDASAADGTMKLARGNAGATTQDIMTVDANGIVRAAQGINLNGQIIETNVNRIGYGSGSGGTVTQTTSRSTAVTINNPTGAITMFSAAGSASWSNFVVNNSVVSATDTIILSQKTGATNIYSFIVTGVSNGVFAIAFSSIAGTATDAPTINFAVIKGAIA